MYFTKHRGQQSKKPKIKISRYVNFYSFYDFFLLRK